MAQNPKTEFLAGGGEMAARIAAFDWSATPLGPIESWPSALKTTVGLMLLSPVPMVALWGEVGTMIYNDGYSRFAGARHPTLLGSEVRKGWPEVADFNDNIMKVVLGRGETLSYREFDLLLYRRGSTEPDHVWFNLDYSPVLDEQGKPIGVLAIVVEITEAHNADARLKENQQRLEFLDRLSRETANNTEANAILAATTRMTAEYLGVTNCAYADMDEDQNGFTIRGDWAAPGAQHILGHYRLADFGKLAVEKLRAGQPLVINDNLKELPPEDAATFQSMGIGATICMPLVKEGRLTALMAIHDKKPHAWTENELALIGEVTERSWAHVERAGSESRYRALFNTMDEGFCIIQFIDSEHGPLSDYVHIEANPAYARHAGIPNVVGQKVREMVPAEAGDWVDLYGEVLRTGKSIRFERELVATGRYLELAAFRIEPASLNQVAVLFQDISARKRAENELRQLNETLEARVAQSLAERVKAEEALRQAQKMEAVGQLTGGLAHDFNNLLAGISGSLELIHTRINQGRTKEVDRYVVAAQGAARRAAAVTHRLLAFSRRQTLAPKAININRLVSGMEEIVRRSIGPGITLEVVGASGLWTALVDPPQLESALLNLCINARDAMPNGGRITVETANKWMDERAAREHDMPQGQYISLCVTDTGTGMPPEVVERVFEPFFTTKPLGQGTGLGLSMIYGFARQSGGQVRIYSEVGKGTTVCIYIPRHYGALDTDEVPAFNVPAKASAGETVLIVDDEPTVRMLVTDILGELGYTAIEAADSVAGLKILQSNVRIDLLISDVGLPGGMNGRQMADAARVRRPDLKVLFITGYAENAIVGNGQLEPDMQLITKPFSMDVMAARIRELMASPSRSRN